MSAHTTATAVKAGDVIVYAISVTNVGGTQGTTTLSDTVPANTTYTGSGQGWSCATGSPANSACTQPVTVAPGATVTKNYTITVVTPLPAGTQTVSNLVTSLVLHGRIETTEVKAKEVRRIADRTISWGVRVLDLLGKDGKNLSAADKVRMDQYFTSVREAELQMAAELQKPEIQAKVTIPEAPPEMVANNALPNLRKTVPLMARLGALAMATDQIIAKARAIAAHQLEAAEDDVDLQAGELSVRGTPAKAMPLQAVAFEAFSAHNLPDGMEPNLTATVSYDPPNFVFPFGTHVAVVEVDEETGEIDLVDYAAVDDCGPQVNPMIVEGQLHGGIVQGVAQALWEEAVYDDEGNLRNATLIDYCVPSAAEVPSFKLDHTVTPSPTNPLGVKGIGEAGTIGSASTIINAVIDALSPLGVTDMAMPAHPQRVWETIQAARKETS